MTDQNKRPAIVDEADAVPPAFGNVVVFSGIEKRYEIVRELLDFEAGSEFDVYDTSGFDPAVVREAMLRAHDEDYVVQVTERFESPENWPGANEPLAMAAVKSLTSSLVAAELIRSGAHDVVYAIPSGQHHARRESGGGFCTLNDVAAAALYLADRGMCPLVFDIDVHAGDGTQYILWDSGIPTISIHEGSLFPYDPMLADTSRSFERHHWHHEGNLAFNFAVESGAGDEALMWALEGTTAIINDYKPDVILFVAGADGAEGTPVASTSYSYEGFDAVAKRVRELALEHASGRVLQFSAGGYQPLDHTPRIWASIFETVAGLR